MNLRDCEEVLARIYEITSTPYAVSTAEAQAVNELAGVASAILERQRQSSTSDKQEIT